MDGLPLIPGYAFQDITKTKFTLPQTCTVRNGYRQMPLIYSGIGQVPLDVGSLQYYSPLEPIKYDPSLTYGRVKNKGPEQVKPHWVIYDKKALTFNAFFKQSVVESPDEHYRVRQVNIIYFLEDDSITVMEPLVDNSGLLQGRLIRRGKIPKDVAGRTWHWKDFNLGMDVAMYGFVLHIVDCDLFTREFLESQGVVVNATEDMPPDPFTMEKKLRDHPHIRKTPLCDDKLRRFLEYDKRILRFYTMWDDRLSELGEFRPFVMYYHLATDCVEVQEVRGVNSGRDPFPLLVKKMRLPKDWTDIPVTFPIGAHEKTEEEVTSYYTPMDFQVGNTIFVLGRRFMIYDCDLFTRNYYKNVLNIIQGPPIDVSVKKPPIPKNPIPPNTVFGQPEDTLQSCLSLRPEPPKKDFLKYCMNANKYLRYEAEFDAVHPEDVGRKFVFSYHLADGTLRINEPPVRNSGFGGGSYLKATRVPKPGADPDNPEFYTPADFYIGACVIVFTQRFFITDADLHVYRYMEENMNKFSKEVIVNIRNHMVKNGRLSEDIGNRACEVQEAQRKQDEEDCDNIPMEEVVLQY